MIVDIHTHLWQNPEQLGPQIAAQLRERFAGSWELLDAGPQAHEQATEPVDVAVVLGFKSRYLGADLSNDYIAEYISRDPRKFIGFAGVDPMDADCVQQIERLVGQGFSGVTISPASQDFHPAHTQAMAVYEACAELRLPVLIHQGTHYTRDSKMEYAQPYLFDEVARQFPALRLVMAHCGHPWVDETLTLIGKHEHVFADLSNIVARPWQLYQIMMQAHHQQVTDHLLFGSDFPYMTPGEAIETMYSINTFSHGTPLPAVPREKLRSIIERDTLEALGIRRPAAPNATPTPAPAAAKPRVKESSE
jgi:predicted TIM-barrel fold metal-dependent hydrolase